MDTDHRMTSYCFSKLHMHRRHLPTGLQRFYYSFTALDENESTTTSSSSPSLLFPVVPITSTAMNYSMMVSYDEEEEDDDDSSLELPSIPMDVASSYLMEEEDDDCADLAVASSASGIGIRRRQLGRSGAVPLPLVISSEAPLPSSPFRFSPCNTPPSAPSLTGRIYPNLLSPSSSSSSSSTTTATLRICRYVSETEPIAPVVPVVALTELDLPHLRRLRPSADPGGGGGTSTRSSVERLFSSTGLATASASNAPRSIQFGSGSAGGIARDGLSQNSQISGEVALDSSTATATTRSNYHHHSVNKGLKQNHGEGIGHDDTDGGVTNTFSRRYPPKRKQDQEDEHTPRPEEKSLSDLPPSEPEDTPSSLPALSLLLSSPSSQRSSLSIMSPQADSDLDFFPCETINRSRSDSFEEHDEEPSREQTIKGALDLRIDEEDVTPLTSVGSLAGSYPGSSKQIVQERELDSHDSRGEKDTTTTPGRQSSFSSSIHSIRTSSPPTSASAFSPESSVLTSIEVVGGGSRNYTRPRRMSSKDGFHHYDRNSTGSDALFSTSFPTSFPSSSHRPSDSRKARRTEGTLMSPTFALSRNEPAARSLGLAMDKVPSSSRPGRPSLRRSVSDSLTTTVGRRNLETRPEASQRAIMSILLGEHGDNKAGGGTKSRESGQTQRRTVVWDDPLPHRIQGSREVRRGSAGRETVDKVAAWKRETEASASTSPASNDITPTATFLGRSQLRTPSVVEPTPEATLLPQPRQRPRYPRSSLRKGIDSSEAGEYASDEGGDEDHDDKGEESKDESSRSRSPTRGRPSNWRTPGGSFARNQPSVPPVTGSLKDLKPSVLNRNPLPKRLRPEAPHGITHMPPARVEFNGLLGTPSTDGGDEEPDWTNTSQWGRSSNSSNISRDFQNAIDYSLGFSSTASMSTLGRTAAYSAVSFMPLASPAGRDRFGLTGMPSITTHVPLSRGSPTMTSMPSPFSGMPPTDEPTPRGSSSPALNLASSRPASLPASLTTGMLSRRPSEGSTVGKPQPIVKPNLPPVGGEFYARALRGKVSSILKRLVKQVPMPESNSVHIVEHGCLNSCSMHLVNPLITDFAERPEAEGRNDLTFTVSHADYPQADFRRLMFAVENDPDSYLSPRWQATQMPTVSGSVYSSYLARPFGAKVIPPNTVSVGLSLMDLHWKHSSAPVIGSKAPSPSSTSSGELLSFLNARAVETRPGGLLILGVITRSENRRVCAPPRASPPMGLRERSGSLSATSPQGHQPDCWSRAAWILQRILLRLVSHQMIQPSVAKVLGINHSPPIHPFSGPQVNAVLAQVGWAWKVEFSCGLDDLESGSRPSGVSEAPLLVTPMDYGKTWYIQHFVTTVRFFYEPSMKEVLLDNGMTRGQADGVLDIVFAFLEEALEEENETQPLDVEFMIVALRKSA